MSDGLLVVGAVIVGVAVVGPLLNHAVLWWLGWRVVLPSCFGFVPRASNVRGARARCARCARPLAPGGVPALPATVVGWRCRGCGARLAGWCAAVELVTGALFGVAAAVIGWSVVLLPVAALVAGLVAMSAVDLVVMRIPTVFVRVTAAALAGGLVVASLVDGPARRLGGAAIGAAVYGGLLLVMHLASPRAMGFGDVRLATVVGAAVGWCAWRPDHPMLAPAQGVFTAGLLAGVLGSVAGIVLLIVRRGSRPFPFGPALAAGGLVVTLGAL